MIMRVSAGGCPKASSKCRGGDVLLEARPASLATRRRGLVGDDARAPDDARESTTAGFSGHLVEPIDPIVVHPTIERILAERSHG
jgi:hypothetical protein